MSECQTTGEHGTVIKYCSGRYTCYLQVQLDCGLMRNYNKTSLQSENKYTNEKGEEIMFGENYKVAMVKFMGGYNDNKYRQFALFEDAKVGDYVLCDNATGHTLGTIGEILTYEEAKEKNKIPVKEIICVCDFTAFNKRKETKAKATELKNRMDKRIKELQTSQIYEMFAEKDDVLKELLAEYKGIIG